MTGLSRLAAPEDPCVCPGTDVPGNHQGIRDVARLGTLEAVVSAQALARLAAEPLSGTRHDGRDTRP